MEMGSGTGAARVVRVGVGRDGSLGMGDGLLSPAPEPSPQW